MEKDNQVNINQDWEDVLNSININSLPIPYLVKLQLNLKNGNKQIIDVKSLLAHGSVQYVTNKINEMMRARSNEIANIDFTIDISAIQRNVTKATNSFTKKVNFKIKRQGKNKKDD